MTGYYDKVRKEREGMRSKEQAVHYAYYEDSDKGTLGCVRLTTDASLTASKIRTYHGELQPAVASQTGGFMKPTAQLEEARQGAESI